MPISKEIIDSAVDKFAKTMKTKLYANSHKGHWVGADPNYLVTRLKEEVDELEVALSNKSGVLGETVDIAAICLMIADAVVGLPTDTQLVELGAEWLQYALEKRRKKLRSYTSDQLITIKGRGPIFIVRITDKNNIPKVGEVVLINGSEYEVRGTESQISNYDIIGTHNNIIGIVVKEMSNI